MDLNEVKPSQFFGAMTTQLCECGTLYNTETVEFCPKCSQEVVINRYATQESINRQAKRGPRMVSKGISKKA